MVFLIPGIPNFVSVMKKIVLLMTALLLACSGASAQNNVLNRLKNRAKNAAEQNIGDKVEKGVNDILDGKLGKDKKNNPQQNQRQGKDVVQEEAAVPEEAAAPQKEVKQGARMKWNNYDFVAGDEIIFEDTMENEQLGEFPSMWDLLRGEAQITEVNDEKCICISQSGAITPLFKDGKTYLTEECTVEYDVFIRQEEPWDAQFGGKEHGWAAWQTFSTYLPAGGRIAEDESGFRMYHGIVNRTGDGLSFNTDLNYDWETTSGDTRNGSCELRDLETEAWHHVAISFNKRALKVYFDDQRVINIPNVPAPGFVWFGVSNDDPYTYFIKNVRIAKGAVPLYERLASAGKIVTYAITFDTGKATIKPESTGEINRITKIMTDDPYINFEIQGHCDNTGSDAVNDPLSQKRAEAIMAALVANGIDASRLTAVGKGAHEPIGDNATDEGRAKNRRVEFVKK